MCLVVCRRTTRMLGAKPGSSDCAGMPHSREQRVPVTCSSLRPKGEREWQGNIRRTPNSDLQVRLTKRESEVLGLVIEGKSNKEVASKLYCSKRTVDFHIARIYDKLNVSNRIQAVRRAALLGLLQTTPNYTD